ncbi:MAG TPA: hypothetical protein VKT72_10565 [Candidatus Baltobacteraceae bacterium]|nr:hypothetical protein [Candidatus Baltobacteraceae bacterium]
MAGWKWILPALCAVTTVALIATVFAVFGFGSRPWLGYWDAQTASTGSPFVVRLTQVVPGGAADRAGLRDGDRIDVRKLDVDARAGVLFQPVATRSMTLPVMRGGNTRTVRFTPSTVYDLNSTLKIVSDALWLFALFWVLCCAWLIAVRRWQMPEAQYLCLTLVAIAAGCVVPGRLVLPSGIACALQYFVVGILGCASAVFPVVLAKRFGAPSLAQRVLDVVIGVIVAVTLAGFASVSIGMLSGSIDPLPFVFDASARILQLAIYVAAAVAVILAVSRTPTSERARAAWLLLPLPIALPLYYALIEGTYSAPSWTVNAVLVIIAGVVMLTAAVAVTFALLARRVLDFQFIVGQALVAGGVSAIVVVAFVLLEWLLGSVFAGHATGIVANAALALALGLSMRFIHARVDAFVDFAFFHERRENERALREFAKEAAFVTTSDDLLDAAMQKIRMHTDARAVSVLVNGSQRYVARRYFGDVAQEARENDAAILALKATHKPVDLHRYATALKGDLALPMLARGSVAGVIVCGARAGGEAYAPDEIEALAEFAQGVGSALDSIGRTGTSSGDDNAILRELCVEIRSLREAIGRLTRG